MTKTLEERDFDLQPMLDVKLPGEAGERGPDRTAGTGKTHMATALAMKALEQGYHVRFSTIQDLAADLKASMADDTTEDVNQESLDPDLVMLDEFVFTRLDVTS